MCHSIPVWFPRSGCLFFLKLLLHTLVIACSTSLVCAVTAMRDYFLPACPCGPLFPFRSGRLLTSSAIVNLLRDAARHIGLPYNSLKGHRFRIGVASTAAAAGLPDWLIKVVGRWSSDCYQIYIHTSDDVIVRYTENGQCHTSHFFSGLGGYSHVSVAV